MQRKKTQRIFQANFVIIFITPNFYLHGNVKNSNPLTYHCQYIRRDYTEKIEKHLIEEKLGLALISSLQTNIALAARTHSRHGRNGTAFTHGLLFCFLCL